MTKKCFRCGRTEEEIEFNDSFTVYCKECRKEVTAEELKGVKEPETSEK